MNFTCNIKKRHFSWLGILLVIFLFTNTVDAFNKKKIEIGNARQFQKISTVMEVNENESFIIISERVYWVTEFKIKGELRKTELQDEAGKAIGLNSFMPRDPVMVQAVELSDGNYIALVVKKLPYR